MVDNRIESNLKMVSKTALVDLPQDKSFTFEDFIATQARFIKGKAQELSIRNAEVERAVNELVDLVQSFPRENTEVHLGENEVMSFRRHYSRLMYQAILAATKASFNAMKKRLGSRASGGFLFVERPIFDVEVQLSIPNVAMSPSLEDIQGAVNTTAKKVLRVSAELTLWGGDSSGAKTFYDLIARDREIVKVVLLLTGSIEGLKNQVMEYVGTFSRYDFLWKLDLAAEYAAFMRGNPTLEQFEAEMKKYMAIEQEIATIAPTHNIGALSLYTAPLKYSLKAEAASWKAQFAKNLHSQGLEYLKAMHDYMRETTLKLNRKIEDLEDVRMVMDLLKELRDKEAEIDTIMTPIEEIYALLGRYEVRVNKDETDMVGELRYVWKKLKKLSGDVSDNLARLQVGFKRELIKEVKLFVVDAVAFRADWESHGPTVPGLDPIDAADRLKKFSQMFEVRKRKWNNYTSGEELFGLAITQYPELEKTEKEIQMLEKLYGLYVNVVTTINGYADILWVDVTQSIDAMTETVTGFSNQCKKLPKSLRDWQAYRDCKKKIDDFVELLPLITSLSSKAMRPRHWSQLQSITGKQFDLREDAFKLGHLLEADLLGKAEDVEDLCNGALKEEQIEQRLAQTADDWSELVFSFGQYKARGTVILEGGSTSEIVEKLEDSQMQLGSMATNRYRRARASAAGPPLLAAGVSRSRPALQSCLSSA